MPRNDRALAVVFRTANKPTLEEVPVAAPKEGEVVTKTVFSGVSIGTEQSIFAGIRTENGTFPLVPGYMSVGIVEALGPGVTNVAVGETVTTGGGRMEGEVRSVWGAHASRIVTKANDLVRLPEGVKPEESSMYVLPNVGLNGTRIAGVTEQDVVLIQGQGLIGQFCGQWSRCRGARIIAIEPNPVRAALSRKYVTPHVLDPKEDLVARVKELTDGKGPSVVVEATASPKLIASATRFLRWQSRMVFLSWYPGEIRLDFHHHFHAHEITALFPVGKGNLETTRATLEGFASGAIIMGDNITDVLPYAKACDGYRRIIDGDRSVVGMVVDWRGVQ